MQKSAEKWKKCAQILWKNEECADIRLEATIVNGAAAVAAEGEPMCAVKKSQCRQSEYISVIWAI